MAASKKNLTILNLTGELGLKLAEYFSSRGILVIDPLRDGEDYDWTHLIVGDEDLAVLDQKYQIIEQGRHVISLSQVKDLSLFSACNGDLVIDELWFEGRMGDFILDKYFQGYGGITLGDNYPAFQELGSFNVTNPFNTGEYLDRMVHKAFEGGLEALSVKTYFDHLVMYLAGLKKKGKAGLPFEITYGAFEDIFAVQVHFYAERLTMKDVSSALSTNISKVAEEYFLNVAVQATDFFDFSYMPEVSKVIVTALWSQDERIRFENRGLMFTSLLNGSPLSQYKIENPTSFLVQDVPPTDFTDSIRVKGTVEGPEEETVVKGEIEDQRQKISVLGQDLGFVDEVRLIKSQDDLDDLVRKVSGKLDLDKEAVTVGGSKLDVEEVSFKIAANVDSTTAESNLKVRSLGNTLPEQIKTGLFDFAKGLGKDADNLNPSDLNRFHIEKMPEIIRRNLQGGVAQLNDSSEIQDQLALAVSENHRLNLRIEVLSLELRSLRDTNAKVVEIRAESSSVADDLVLKEGGELDVALKNHFEQKHAGPTKAEILEREAKLIQDVKESVLKSRKLQIESNQKEVLFAKELNKVETQLKARDLMLTKSKETFTKVLGKKNDELAVLGSKVEQLQKALNAGNTSSSLNQVKELERMNQSLAKQIEFYKSKVSNISTNMETTKSDDVAKEENRRLSMLVQQLKNQIAETQRDAEKNQAKNVDNVQFLQLKMEKQRLEQLLKKSLADGGAEDNTPGLAPVIDPELNRLQGQNQVLENQLKDSLQKMAALEAKLAEALKSQRAPTDDGSKVKVTQLENSLKKLTQDLSESRNQNGEMKKESNKLRQEKTAIQNQLDRLKKDMEKLKAAAPKKSGGKAA